jgi:hypothetical protein
MVVCVFAKTLDEDYLKVHFVEYNEFLVYIFSPCYWVIIVIARMW